MSDPTEPSAAGDHAPIRIDTLFYRETDRSYAVEAHFHRIHQWYVLLHGGVDMTIDGQVLELQPQQSVIIPPGAIRSPRCRQRAPGYLVAIFACRDLDLAAVTGRVLDLPMELRDELLSLVEEVRLPSGPDSRHFTSAVLTRLLIGLKRAAAQHQPRSAVLQARQHHELVAQADAFMERNFYRHLSRGDISRSVHLSEPHLGRVFRSATGKTVLHRLTEIRMTHAKTLLLESDLSATQIALDVGITSFSHFAYIFKKATGLTPSDYRRSRGRQYG